MTAGEEIWTSYSDVPVSGPEYGEYGLSSLWGSFIEIICNQEIVWGEKKEID